MQVPLVLRHARAVPYTAFILSVFIPGAVGSLVFRHEHQLICLMKVE